MSAEIKGYLLIFLSILIFIIGLIYFWKIKHNKTWKEVIGAIIDIIFSW